MNEPATDLLLARLVRAVEERELDSFPVVLTVSGLLLEGRIISSARYGELFGETVAHYLPPQASEETEQWFRQVGAELPELEDIGDLIHVQVERFVVGVTSYTLPPPAIWRGRLEMIAGWALRVGPAQ